MTVLFTARLLLAAIVTALSGSLVFSFHESAAAGQGMAKAFALLASIFLWVVLGGLVLICIKRGGLPGRTVLSRWCSSSPLPQGISRRSAFSEGCRRETASNYRCNSSRLPLDA
jgi:hypothetical protein